MGPQNITGAWEFILSGLSEDPDLQSILFGLFLSIYLVTVLGNLLIILTVSSDSHLHTPMYFFLCNLSLADIGFSSAIILKMLVNMHMRSKSIAYVGCLAQVSCFIFFGCLDSLLLTVMAYDRLVAICHPLHYPIIMHPRLCGLLVLLSLSISLLDSQLHCLILSQLTFCTGVEIPHFFCDPLQMFKLACDYTSNNTIVIFIMGAIFGGIPVSGILYSYTRIISSILKIPSTDGKYKAFSTCGSHLVVVCLFYGTGLGEYFSLPVSHTPKKVMAASAMYALVTPILNPFVYSLRNRDIKHALWRILCRTA